MRFVWLIFFPLASAYAVTPEQVIQSAWNEKSYLAFNEVQSTHSANPLRTVEVFVADETKEGKDTVETGFKLQMKSLPEWKIANGHESQSQLMKDASLGWALKNRYSVILQIELNRRKLGKVEEALKLADSYLKAQNLSLKAGKATSKAYLGAQNEVYKFKRYQSALLQEQDALNTKLKAWVKEGAGPLTNYDLIGVDEISQALQSNPQDTDSLTKKISEAEIKLMGEELEIVKGREQQWFKNIQFSHVRKDNENQYEVELGFQIPAFGHDVLAKQKQNELILKRALKQRDLDEAGDRLQTLRLQILNLIELYKGEKKLSDFKVGTLDPMANIERKISEQQEQLDLLNKHQEICSLYLDYLLESQLLIKNPEKNYLQKTLQAKL